MLLSGAPTLDLAVPRQTAARCRAALSSQGGITEPENPTRVAEFVEAAAKVRDVERPALDVLLATEFQHYTVTKNGTDVVGLSLAVRLQDGGPLNAIFDQYAAFLLWEELDQALKQYG